MDRKQDQVPFDFLEGLIKTEPVVSGQIEQNEYGLPRSTGTVKIEPLDMLSDSKFNVPIFHKTIKQEIENTSDIKVSNIKQEISEYVEYVKPKTENEMSALLTSHCELPTLKIESIESTADYLVNQCSSKSLEKTGKVILTRKRRYECPICEKNLPSKSKSIHINGHFKKCYSVCYFCGKIMNKMEFLQHFFIHVVKNGTKNNMNDKPMKYNLPSIHPFNCDICSQGFNNIHNLQYHHILAHSSNHSFKCDICSKEFIDKSNLKKHLVIHTGEKPFKCGICSKAFYRNYNLQCHLIIHSGEKPFQCDICLKGFNRKSYLQSHLIIHSDEKPFKCEICSNEFIHKSSLQTHLIIHSGEKPFKCDICSKGFTDKSNLQKHLIIHTGEKPFKCDICNKGFSYKSSLQRHLIIHTDQKPFECDICSKQFSQKFYLNTHLKVHAKKKP